MIKIYILLISLIQSKRLKDISFSEQMLLCDLEDTILKKGETEVSCEDYEVNPVCGFKKECTNAKDKSCYVTYPNECEACKASQYYKKNKCDFYKKIVEKNYQRVYCNKDDRSEVCTFCNSNGADISEKCYHRTVCGRVNADQRKDLTWEQFKNGCLACQRPYINYYEIRECFDINFT